MGPPPMADDWRTVDTRGLDGDALVVLDRTRAEARETPDALGG